METQNHAWQTVHMAAATVAWHSPQPVLAGLQEGSELCSPRHAWMREGSLGKGKRVWGECGVGSMVLEELLLERGMLRDGW